MDVYTIFIQFINIILNYIKDIFIPNLSENILVYGNDKVMNHIAIENFIKSRAADYNFYFRGVYEPENYDSIIYKSYKFINMTSIPSQKYSTAFCIENVILDYTYDTSGSTLNSNGFYTFNNSKLKFAWKYNNKFKLPNINADRKILCIVINGLKTLNSEHRLQPDIFKNERIYNKETVDYYMSSNIDFTEPFNKYVCEHEDFKKMKALYEDIARTEYEIQFIHTYETVLGDTLEDRTDESMYYKTILGLPAPFSILISKSTNT